MFGVDMAQYSLLCGSEISNIVFDGVVGYEVLFVFTHNGLL